METRPTIQNLMSSHVIGSLYDIKSEIYSPPHLFRSTADFIRTIQTEAKNPQSMLHKFPSDYELHVVGQWNEYSGILDDLDKKRLGSVLDLCPLT